MSEKRITLRLDEETHDMLKYWSNKEDVSINQFIIECIHHNVGFLNHDYDIPDAMIRRVNQLVDVINILASNQKSLEEVIINGFDSIMGLARGDNYLLDEEKGDL